jgi:hypothetical protein
MSIISTATFRTVGNAATTHNLFTIYNTDATVVVRLRRLVMQMDATAVLTAVMPLVKTTRITVAPTGGTVLTKTLWDSTVTSDADVVCRGATASDGGAATAITATVGTVLWQQYGFRLHTAVGQVLGLDNNVVSSISETTPVFLRQNEGLLVQVVAAAGTSNPATNQWFVQAAWDEGGT